MKTTKFVRKPMYVIAIQVTDENFQEVASWCGGKVEHIKGGSTYIKVLDNRAKLVPRTKAFVGDWVLEGHNGYRVYTNVAFEKAFDEVVADNWAKSHEEAMQLIFPTNKVLSEEERINTLTPEEKSVYLADVAKGDE